jgi:predicted O-linked N-acetylglucosamine transferase (SPINDLY family)
MPKRRAARSSQQAKAKTRSKPRSERPFGQGSLKETLAEGLRRHQAGDLEAAGGIYARVLERQPDHLDALQLLGTLALQTGDAEKSAELLARALQQAPDDGHIAANLAGALLKLERNAEALAAARTASRTAPGHAGAWNNLGTALRRMGENEEALAAFETALANDPHHAQALANRDNLKVATDLAHNVQALVEGGQVSKAERAVAEALQHRPHDTEILRIAATLTVRLGRFAAARTYYERALENSPGNADLLADLSFVLLKLGELHQALDVSGQAISAQPDSPYVLLKCGEVLFGYGKLDQAREVLTRCYELSPSDPQVMQALGNVYGRQGAASKAAMLYLEALCQDRDNPAIISNLANMLRDQGYILAADEQYRRAFELKPNSAIHSNLLLNLEYLNGLSPDALYDAHREWGLRHNTTVLPSPESFPNDRDPERRLRVGYVSGDFRQHSVSYFFEPLLDNHDRRQVEVVLYSDVERADAWTQRMRENASVFRHVADHSAEALAEQIRADRIDILVDLAGHTGKNRQKTFALKPAPVQVSWLGYPDTTGNLAIDYRFTDAIVEPEGAEARSSETLLRLPNGFHCYRPHADAPAVEPRRRDDASPIVFGSFNAVQKLTSEVVELWAAIMAQVPESRMIIKHRSMADPVVQTRYVGLFETAGIDPARVSVMQLIPEVQEHLSAYNLIDISLDPFPYNGTTTTCEALWMGVPVVALLGDRHASRVSASLLHRVGLDPLVAPDTDAYKSIAVSLARDPAGLRELRQAVRPMMAASKLRDESGFGRDVEAQFREIWRNWCAKRSAGNADTPLPSVEQPTEAAS